MSRQPHKTFTEGEAIEFNDEKRWRPGTYLNAYGTYHIIEDRKGYRIAVTDSKVRRKERKLSTQCRVKTNTSFSRGTPQNGGKMSPVRKVGDRVSWSASPSAADCRTVYTGEIIEARERDMYAVRDDGWLAISAVPGRRLHDEGAFEIIPTGPRGIRWTDR